MRIGKKKLVLNVHEIRHSLALCGRVSNPVGLIPSFRNVFLPFLFKSEREGGVDAP